MKNENIIYCNFHFITYALFPTGNRAFNILTLIISDILIIRVINSKCNALMMSIYYIQSHAASLGTGKEEPS